MGLIDTIETRKAEFEGAMAVDWSLHAILTKAFSYDEVEEIGQAIRDGVPTIKTMMTYGYMSDDGQRYGAMLEVAEHGGMSVVHAEDDAIANWLTGKYVREGKTHGAYICEVRGPIVEEAAIRRAMFLAERTGSPLYVLHMAAGSGIEALAEKRAQGLPFYGETLSAYLSFTQDDLWDESPIEVDGTTYNARGALFNNYPMPKFGPDRDTCWAALADGRLQVVATDHALVSLKDRFETMGTTVDAMQAGQAAVETRIPLLYSEGVGQGPDQRRALGRAHLGEPGEAHGHVAAQGPDRGGRRRGHRRLRPRAALDRRLARAAHERRLQLLGRLGGHRQGARHDPARVGARRGRGVRRLEDRRAVGAADDAAGGRSPATSRSARSPCEDRLREAACVAGGVEVAGERRHDGGALEQDQELAAGERRVGGRGVRGQGGEQLAVAAEMVVGHAARSRALAGGVDDRAPAEPLLRVPAAEGVEHREDTVDRVARRVRGVAQPGDDVVAAPAEHGFDQLVLAAEVAVEADLGDPGARRELVDARAHAVAVEDLGRGAQELLAGALDVDGLALRDRHADRFYP